MNAGALPAAGLCTAASVLLLTVAAFGADSASTGEGSEAFGLISEQVILIATVVATAASLPALIEFLVDRRKRKERIALSLDDLTVADLDVRLAGLDELLADIADLIDRAKNPEAYASLKVGNEILIVGPDQSGKKALAQRIARDAGMHRLIVVYNARNADALTKAKSLIQRYRRQKVMLLLPRLDLAVEHENEEALAELDTLVNTSSGKSNVLVVGTTVKFRPGDIMDSMFGIVLALPGTPPAEAPARPLADDVRRLLADVAKFYLAEAHASGALLSGIGEPEAIERIARTARNPADVEDIIMLARTTALYRQRTAVTRTPEITAETIDKSVRRVIVSAATG